MDILEKTEPVDYKAEVAREKGLTESQSQEVGDLYRSFSKKHNIDLDELIYGSDGFMAINYPDGFPDFNGDIVYSEHYWNEFVNWAKEKYGLDLSESLTEFYNMPAIESDQKLYGIDNAIVDCQKYDLVAHSEDEKPLDCKMEKAPLEKPLTEGATPAEIKETKELAAKIGINTVADLQDFVNREALVDETPLETLKRYIAWLGDDFKLKDESKGADNKVARKSEFIDLSKFPELDWVDDEKVSLDDLSLESILAGPAEKSPFKEALEDEEILDDEDITVDLTDDESVEDTTAEAEVEEAEDVTTQDATDIINKCKQNGGRIISVGTTACRTMESATDKNGVLQSGSSSTGIFIYPGYKYKMVDCLVTNFHLPKSTLLMLVSALYNRDKVLEAYNIAVQQRYRFFSYGDACLII